MYFLRCPLILWWCNFGNWCNRKWEGILGCNLVGPTGLTSLSPFPRLTLLSAISSIKKHLEKQPGGTLLPGTFSAIHYISPEGPTCESKVCFFLRLTLHSMWTVFFEFETHESKGHWFSGSLGNGESGTMGFGEKPIQSKSQGLLWVQRHTDFPNPIVSLSSKTKQNKTKLFTF